MPSVYEIVTEQITNLLESGNIPWHKPWNSAALCGPANAITHRAYSGLNTFMLEATKEKRGYTENLWLTYKQAQEAGGNVRKGEHGTIVVFWKWLQSKDETTGKADTFPMLRYYTVFNVSQCDNIKYRKQEPAPLFPQSDVYENMPNRPELKHSGGKACYYPTADTVYMPATKFETEGHYFATLFHELSHATGHATRLNRFAQDGSAHHFGDEVYSKEELVAELSSAFICAATGTDNQELRTNSAAYIQSWLKALQNDKTMIVYAAARAQKSADYILNRRQEKDTPENE